MFSLAERKLFSLPKMALLPSVLLRHPRLALAGLPIILGLDAAKSALHAALTDAFEEHRKAEKRADSRLARVVAFDLAQASHLLEIWGDMGRYDLAQASHLLERTPQRACHWRGVRQDAEMTPRRLVA